MKIGRQLLLDYSKRAAPVVPYRYYRMMITARNEPQAITVGEWELYDSNGINRARGKPSFASDAGFGDPSGAFDGIVPVNLQQGRWQTNAPANPQWISVDLGAVYSINRTILYCDSSQIPNYAQYSPNTWYFQGSLDNTNWNDILQVVGHTTTKWLEKRAHEWSFV